MLSLRLQHGQGAALLRPAYAQSMGGIKPRRTTLKTKSRDEDLAKAPRSGDAGKGPVQSGRWPDAERVPLLRGGYPRHTRRPSPPRADRRWSALHGWHWV